MTGSNLQVIEYALSLLPFESVSVNTPQGVVYQGKRCSVKKICGVSILRAGETMEAALTEVCKDIRVGKILIQTSPESGEPGNLQLITFTATTRVGFHKG